MAEVNTGARTPVVRRALGVLVVAVLAFLVNIPFAEMDGSAAAVVSSLLAWIAVLALLAGLAMLAYGLLRR